MLGDARGANNRGIDSVELGEEIAEGLRILVGFDIEVPLRLTLVIDRQTRLTGQEGIGDEFGGVDPPNREPRR